jgi:hypothetical protein
VAQAQSESVIYTVALTAVFIACIFLAVRPVLVCVRIIEESQKLLEHDARLVDESEVKAMRDGHF